MNSTTVDPLEAKDMLKSATIYRNSEFNYLYVCFHCESSFTNITDTLSHIESHFDVKESIVDDSVTKLTPETHLYEWEVNSSNDDHGSDTDSKTADQECKVFAEDVKTDFKKCTLCRSKFDDVALLMMHTIKDHAKTEKLVCPKCDESIKGEKRFSTHIRKHITADETTYDAVISQIVSKCEANKKDSAEPRPLTKHQLKYLKTCDICQSHFTTRKRLIGHMRSMHENKFYNCEKCNDRKIIGKFNFYAHQYGHMTNDEQVTALDDKNLRRKLRKFLNENISTNDQATTSKQTYDCKICGHLSLTNYGGAELHILQKHVYFIQSNPFQDKRYVCEQCGRKFALSSNLKSHVLTHSKEKPFVCTICNKAFAQQKYLKTHNKIHTGFKPHQCSQCGKTFLTNHELRLHTRTHGEENVTKCSICNKEVKVYRLKIHLQEFHGNEQRPFECPVCLETFKSTKALTNHSFQHFGKKKLECRFQCQQSFMTFAGRRAHERNKHEAK